MKFGPVPLDEAEGAILAHSVPVTDGAVRKGTRLALSDIGRLRTAGVTAVTVARLESGDLTETEAAEAVGAALASPGLDVTAAVNGRVNLVATDPGVVLVDSGRVGAFNGIDEGLTLATLADGMRVEADQLVATVKIIPYALPGALVARGVAALGAGGIRLQPFRGGTARLVLTRTPDFKPSLLAKGEAVVRDRIEALGYRLTEVVTVEHAVEALADALGPRADLTLVLGASATSDRHDVAPMAVIRAGGEIERFGMPVDPGNLLFIGRLGGTRIVGLPGCARSPALNGVDWVLERIAAGLDVTSADIAAMGVGGLLKEMPGRPEPRRPRR